jgi:putative copper export protein
VVIVLVIVASSLSLAHRSAFVNTERSLARLRTSITLDVALVLLVLILTAILTGTTPPVR